MNNPFPKGVPAKMKDGRNNVKSLCIDLIYKSVFRFDRCIGV